MADSISGIYEAGIGVPDPIAALQYWQQFGYRIGQVGELAADRAQSLYCVNAALRSIRLHHQDADHGLIRLMIWSQPVNEGLGMAPMRVKGNRWATTLTADVLNILNHAEAAAEAGLPVRYTPPRWEIIYNKARQMQPFVDTAIGVREMMLLQPLARQILFERFGYSMQNYGAIDLHAPLQASQFTHMGMVIQDDSKATLRFYEELGLLRVRDDVETNYDSLAGRDIFDLKPGEKFFVTAFDDPRSSATNFQLARSGRLYIIRFPNSMPIASCFEQARPGCLGMSLYTYQVSGLEAYFDRLQSSSAQQVTAIVPNEFGEPSFSFVAPDGYFWTLVERAAI